MVQLHTATGASVPTGPCDPAHFAVEQIVQPEAAMLGQVLGSYQVVGEIGEGGMATVYAGEHRLLHHKVAIKLLHPHHLRDPAQERRFLNEARAIAAVHHPGIVGVHDFGRAPDGRAFIVMELLEGESLRRRLNAGPLPEDRVITLARQIATALTAAHDCDIIHRDLKPENIFLIRDEESRIGERAKILDFGIAKFAQLDPSAPELTAAGIVIGTPEYMSPEQCLGSRTIDGRSDIYSLGVLMYRMVTGHLPFSAEKTAEIVAGHLYEQLPPPRSRLPSLSAGLDRLIVRCLAKNPEERPATAADVAAALGELESELLTPGKRPNGRPQPAAPATGNTRKTPLVARPKQRMWALTSASGVGTAPPTSAASSATLPRTIAAPLADIIDSTEGVPTRHRLRAPRRAPPRRGRRALWLAFGLAMTTGAIWFVPRSRPVESPAHAARPRALDDVAVTVVRSATSTAAGDTPIEPAPPVQDEPGRRAPPPMSRSSGSPIVTATAPVLRRDERPALDDSRGADAAANRGEPDDAPAGRQDPRPPARDRDEPGRAGPGETSRATPAEGARNRRARGRGAPRRPQSDLARPRKSSDAKENPFDAIDTPVVF
jgi:serine/threonine protein kinase